MWVSITTNVVALAAIPVWAALADRVGRKPVFIGGAIGSGALMFAYLAAIENGSYPLIFLAAIFMSGVVYSAMNGVQPALYGEMFPIRVRLSGMAIGTQIGYAIGGFAPTAASAIAGDGPTRSMAVRTWAQNRLPRAASSPAPACPSARGARARYANEALGSTSNDGDAALHMTWRRGRGGLSVPAMYSHLNAELAEARVNDLIATAESHRRAAPAPLARKFTRMPDLRQRSRRRLLGLLQSRPQGAAE